MAKTKRGRPEFDLRPVVEMMGGLDKVIEKLGKREVIDEIGIDGILANLTPAQRRELRRRLNAPSEGKENKD